MNPGSNPKKWLAWLKPVIGLTLFTVVARQVDMVALRALLERGESEWLLLSVVGFTASLSLFQSMRLHLLVKGYTGSVLGSLRLFFVGAFFNNLLPSNVGGDAVRLMYLRKMGDRDWAAPLALLLFHRLSGLLTIVTAFAAYVLLDGTRLWQRVAGRHLELDSLVVGAVVLGVAALGALGVTLLFRTELGGRIQGRIGQVWARMGVAIRELSWPRLMSLALLTLAFHGARMVGFYACVRYFGQTIMLWDLVPVLMLIAVMALLPITVGGLGVVEGSIGLGLGLFGVAPEAAVATALVHRMVMLIVALIGGLVYAVDRPRQR